MFVDSVDIFITSGSGGAGCVSFRREKFVIQGGPDGGDGGRGGDVIFEVDNNAHTLANFRGKKHHKAGNGEAGKPKRCAGKSGANCIIKVPLGTQILDIESGEVLHDFGTDCKDSKATDTRFVALKGGKGGLGNAHFKTATNQAPTYAQKGIAGQSLHIKLELKLIADVGLVGYPNVGKSTLISTLSNAKPEVANYEFTTLTPHLGVVESTQNGANGLKGFGESFVMADIPGIIEGASEGKGLGLQFLQHIERTKFLLFVLDCTRLEFGNLELAHLEFEGGLSLKEQFCTLRNELQSYSSTLATRSFGIALSKIDALQDEAQIAPQIAQLSDFANSLQSPPAFILPISAITRKNLNELKLYLFQSLQKL